MLNIIEIQCHTLNRDNVVYRDVVLAVKYGVLLLCPFEDLIYVNDNLLSFLLVLYLYLFDALSNVVIATFIE